jgi:N-acetylmuramoyl-L-alanine amidase
MLPVALSSRPVLACWSLLLGLTMAYAARAATEVSATAPVAIAAELASEGPATRLTLVLSQTVTPHAFVMERPDRVIVDLPEVNFQLPAGAGRRREGVVTSFRHGLFAPGRSRVVIDLAQPALVSRVDFSVREADGATLVEIELTRTDRETFRRAAADRSTAALVSASPEAERDTGNDRRPLIMVDPGHGGIDPGAIGASGVFEKDIVFGFAQRLVQRLRTSGRYRVQMTRERDVFVPLGQRVRLSRAAKADLFISIHADSISAAPQVHGGTVYTGAEQASDTESAQLADRENKADAVGGADSRDSATDVADILQDLTLRETRGFSRHFAKKLLGEINPVMQMSAKPYREAGFAVLRAPDVPSVLVELGYVSSRRDLDLLMSSEWRDRTSGAMVAAIDRYFATRIAAGRAAAVSP